MKYLTRKEELILLTIYRLEESASLVKIRDLLITSTGHNWTVGNVYVPLDRMDKLGYLETCIGEPTSQRGGKAVKFYTLSRKGKKALSDLKKVHDRMWADLPEMAYEK
jgi:PadR family transcriptional regulator PadR